MNVGHFLLQHETNKVINIGDDNQRVGSQSGSIYPIAQQRHVYNKGQPDKSSTNQRNNSSETG